MLTSLHKSTKKVPHQLYCVNFLITHIQPYIKEEQEHMDMPRKYLLTLLILLAAPVLANTPTKTVGEISTKDPIDTLEVKKEKSFTGKFALMTNYIYRGISETDNHPAAQFALSYSFLPAGIYVSLFATNDYFFGKHGERVTYETDPSFGITNKIGEYFTYDISISRYLFPQANINSYNEYNLNLDYYFLTAQLSYSNNVYAVGKSGTYYNLGFNYDVPVKYFFCIENINVTGGVGYYHLPQSAGLHSYMDYNLALKKSISQVDFILQWTDTNRQSVDPVKWKGNKIVGAIAINF